MRKSLFILLVKVVSFSEITYIFAKIVQKCIFFHAQKYEKNARNCQDFLPKFFTEEKVLKILRKRAFLVFYTRNMRLTLVNFCCNLLNHCTNSPICAIFSTYFEKKSHFLLPKKGRFRVKND